MTHPQHLHVHRTGTVLHPDRSRVLIRPFVTSDTRALKIMARVMTLTDDEVKGLLEEVLREFAERHGMIEEIFLSRFEDVKQFMLTDAPLTWERRMLIGSYFTNEYSLESAALFNPSIVIHPDQNDVPEGGLRFILSLRATGEGHISSITFRTGYVTSDSRVEISDPTRFVTIPKAIRNVSYERELFVAKLVELNLHNEHARTTMSLVHDTFTFDELKAALIATMRNARIYDLEEDATARGILLLARSNYEVQFAPEQKISERVIFPFTPSQVNGIEDARFVLLEDAEEGPTYYATYTAFDGKIILPQLLETKDFTRFRFITLNGPAVANKGMALFPRKIKGRYAMLGRQDGENIFLMYSDNLHFWREADIIMKPTAPWEFVQLGNCGSPMETERGWLVLSHGVGAMRKYCIGAFLLDRDDPSKIVGRLPFPLLTPIEHEREGYVPNVVYSCGAIIHNGTLIIPYAMSDYATSFATVPLQAVLDAMV